MCIRTATRQLKTEQKGCTNEKRAWLSRTERYEGYGRGGHALNVRFEETIFRGRTGAGQYDGHVDGGATSQLTTDKLMWTVRDRDNGYWRIGQKRRTARPTCEEEDEEVVRKAALELEDRIYFALTLKVPDSFPAPEADKPIIIYQVRQSWHKKRDENGVSVKVGKSHPPIALKIRVADPKTDTETNSPLVLALVHYLDSDDDQPVPDSSRNPLQFRSSAVNGRSTSLALA